MTPQNKSPCGLSLIDPQVATTPPQAYKARILVPFTGEAPARGKALFSPLRIIENAWLTIANGQIAEIGKKRPILPDCRYHDLGDVAILPGVSNCHTHLQLSWLAGKPMLGCGFTKWLRSLVRELVKYTQVSFTPEANRHLCKACEQLSSAGTSIIGDIGGSLPDSVQAVAYACRGNNLSVTLFCENFGFAPVSEIWPERCRKAITSSPELEDAAAPCGHALYSTSPQTMQMAHAWCRLHKKPFTFHLAESPEETELLASASGSLYNFYKNIVLSQEWRAPGLTPFQFALKLGLLSPGTIAVHCVQFSKKETRQFAQTGATACLCPRSNQAIGTGQPDIKSFIQENVLLCLGTDGLTSAPDLDIRQEAIFVRNKHDLPWPALWRMAVSNGAFALGHALPVLKERHAPRFSVWPLF